MTAADIVKALDGRMRTRSSGTVCCPAHKDRSPSLSITDGAAAGFLVHCFVGCPQVVVVDALRRLGAWPGQHEKQLVLAEAEAEKHRQQKAKRERVRRDAFVTMTWQQTWAEALLAPGSPVERWLRHRGIYPAKVDLDRMPLRRMPRCPRGRDAMPAMLALMTHAITCRPCGIHRTFFLPDGSGKAVVDPVRQMLGSAGVIRVSPDDEVELGLGIAEGIETALAVMAAGWSPIWAAGSLNAVRRFPLLSGVECLTIFADPKPHEVAGARACADRWFEAGREAIVRIPKGGVWNDVLMEASFVTQRPRLAFCQLQSNGVFGGRLDAPFVHAWGAWYHWTGKRWERETTLLVQNMSRDLCREVAHRSNRMKLESAKTVGAVVQLARSDRRLAATPAQWDADPWALNTPGGIVNLRTGILGPHRPEAFCTKSTAATPGGECPLWRSTLDYIFAGNQEVISFYQRWMGYSLTGVTTEHPLRCDAVVVFGEADRVVAAPRAFMHRLYALALPAHRRADGKHCSRRERAIAELIAEGLGQLRLGHLRRSISLGQCAVNECLVLWRRLTA